MRTFKRPDWARAQSHPARVLAEEMVDGMPRYATRLGRVDDLLGVRRLIESPPAERRR